MKSSPLLAQASLALAVTSIACASPPPPPEAPPATWETPGYGWPGTSSASKAPEAPRAPEASTELDRSRAKSAPAFAQPAPVTSGRRHEPQRATPAPINAPLLSQNECLAELQLAGITFLPMERLRGVEVPVEIQSPLGGVTFWTDSGRKLQMDCRLALAVHRLGPIFEKHGVTRARFSGAYVYRTTRGGRLSHHAYGLALDVHDFTISGQRLSVKEDFTTGVSCDANDAPALNRLSCDLRETLQFQEFLTPDYNADHRDHLHISVPRRR